MAKVNKTPPNRNVPAIRTKVPKGVAPRPGKVIPNKANPTNIFERGGLQKAAEWLRRIEAPTPRSIAGAARFAATAAGVRGPVIETAAAALEVLGEMYARSPSGAAAELQRMALGLLVPNKGGQNI